MGSGGKASAEGEVLVPAAVGSLAVIHCSSQAHCSGENRGDGTGAGGGGESSTIV